ncbi:transaldolase [Lichenihabitans sp. PAMC28606]|uniref:transaldolase n=1 Tax=Lichenihabitans sp. PAMC28606 TaxID=2880932 RepID=UPI001D0AA48C|nr:transaldolase [Lichenihabitans sp. PAMC28606]UDL95758.1 transaldolase [Lichenihabitans sp. PAMC28606]
MNPLVQLESCGQSPWLDDLHRDLVRKGDLATAIGEDGLKGLTSNPSIFEKGIGETDEYKDDLAALLDEGVLDDMRVYEALAAEDIKGAADLFRPVYDKHDRNDGFVSWEVSPYLANETDKTIEEAKRLWGIIGRDNLMIKIPGTHAGLPAIRDVIGAGINVNVTLLFGIEAYAAVADAYMGGLEELVRDGGDPSTIASVASFFLSRIDVAVDERLKDLGDTAPGLVDKVTDKVGIASAKLAYARYKEIYATPRWQALAAKGARPQRLLWASTGTKKTSLPDTYYIDSIIGRETVNTMPPATLKAFRDHGTATPDTIEQGMSEVADTMGALQTLGLSIDEITADLVKEGVVKFHNAFDKLLGGVAKKRRELATHNDQSAPSGATKSIVA